MLEPTSRYYHLADVTYTDAQGCSVIYKSRRFLPQGAKLPLLAEVTVSEGDRLDLIANSVFGAPEQFWRICDANNAMNPFELTDNAGQTLRISPPQFQEVSS